MKNRLVCRWRQKAELAMVMGMVRARLSIPEARSLKDKRAVLRSVLDRIRNEVNVSTAEVGDQDQWRFAELAFVTVAAEAKTVQQRISTISRRLESDPRYVLVDIQTQLA